jgi:hypothetical protein
VFFWTLGRPAVARAVPPAASFSDSSDSYGWCVWSPDGRSVLCASTAGRDQGNWVVASSTAGIILAVRGPGLPLAWLPGRSST